MCYYVIIKMAKQTIMSTYLNFFQMSKPKEITKEEKWNKTGEKKDQKQATE